MIQYVNIEAPTYTHFSVIIAQQKLRIPFMCLVSNVLSFSPQDPDSDPFIEELAKKLCGMDCFVRGKYGALCCLVNILGARAILELHATVPQDLMMIMCEQSIVAHVCNSDVF